MLCLWIHNYLAIEVKTPKKNLQAYEACKIGNLGYVRAKPVVQMGAIHTYSSELLELEERRESINYDVKFVEHCTLWLQWPQAYPKPATSG